MPLPTDLMKMGMGGDGDKDGSEVMSIRGNHSQHEQPPQPPDETTTAAIAIKKGKELKYNDTDTHRNTKSSPPQRPLPPMIQLLVQ